ncbi:MAG: hypothetical protein H0X24_07365 [Ktedonobacterales bacterium]|nr:hypothetical protein [Ktedonobacterales bacterium]
MQSTISLPWGASYQGIGIAILTLSDGTYQGVTQNGYRTVPYATTQAALEDITAHIKAQGGQ